ncbi:MAG: cupin domain-containing protein [Chloroflexi bacterium]|nr:MAG: cupin domain-containing protein [Chloroflexota bacterium]
MTNEHEHAPFERRANVIRTVDAFPGVTRRTLASGDKLMLVEIAITEGNEVPEHTHPHEQGGSVREGRIRITVGGVVTDLEAGDAYMIPGGVVHHVVALTPAILIEAFSPPREEFLGDLV